MISRSILTRGDILFEAVEGIEVNVAESEP